MNITIFGSGYVGLVTGACLAEVGNHVVCMDVDRGKIDRLNNGEIPIYEPGLEELIQHARDQGNIEFTTDLEKAVGHGVFQMIAVGTPPDEDGSADMQYVLAVAESIGQHMNDYKIIIDKSTVPVGTAEMVRAKVNELLGKRNKSLEFDVVSNPEFLKEGAAIDDFMKPDRIVIGTDNPRTTELLRVLYTPFNRNHDRIIAMDIPSAELTKYAANAMLATKISFMNEMANIAERVGADIEHVRQGIGSDHRIGFQFIYPGCGYGGSCFPKDVQALSRTATSIGYDAKVLNAVEATNELQKEKLFGKISKFYNGDLAGKVIALWGLSFKPRTDDMRAAPSRNLLERLIAEGASVRAFDPVAMDEARHIYGDTQGLEFCDSAEEAVQGADVLAIVTEWKNFWGPDFANLADKLADKAIFDGRNLYDPAAVKPFGLRYFAIGRGEQLN
ncbi:MAG TPA: UDP-glucose/GDP-mannose dehydrogenase family protein [Gammaproteobacteria bacterium]|nr:UDP-glucose/GDP-mannose dehydrogenase family protein [Gammaproteobacteria bacterium]